ncbi:cysteine rich repeat-containing protein [Afipia sp. 1NLS2]|nr:MULTISPECIES: cysteine rich repeat-containing protein [Afipia]
MKFIIVTASVLLLSATASGLAQTGPVAAKCAKDIQTYCPNKSHGRQQVRSCLESNRSKVSAECRKALDTTGPGRGRNQ